MPRRPAFHRSRSLSPFLMLNIPRAVLRAPRYGLTLRAAAAAGFRPSFSSGVTPLPWGVTYLTQKYLPTFFTSRPDPTPGGP